MKGHDPQLQNTLETFTNYGYFYRDNCQNCYMFDIYSNGIHLMSMK